MNDGHEQLEQPILLQLTQQQKDVVRALQGRENDRYPLSQWYLGALYVLDNQRNPDRIAQAAHSLRELLEKLPMEALESDLQGNSNNFPEIRREIAARIARDQQRYPEGWNGKPIDRLLAETLEKASLYFEKIQQPSRREQVRLAIMDMDPLADQFDAKILNLKRDSIYKLSMQFQKLAHHRGKPDAEEFETHLEFLGKELLDLFAPITAQDQQEIRSILKRTDRTDVDVERIFTLMERRGANYVFFFDQATDPSWIPLLREKGYFSNPPSMGLVGEDQWNAPYWWPLHYLSRVAHHEPDTVVKIVEQLPQVDNPRITYRILDIALQLPGVQSTKLKPKVLEISESILSFLDHWYSELLTHWVNENEVHAALELANVLVRFKPDPRSQHNRGSSPKNGIDWIPPVPKVEEWEYRRMFEKSVRPLAEKVPNLVARMLANATEEMIRLRTRDMAQGEGADEDLSEVWCRRLGSLDDSFEESSNVLIEGLTFACEKVFEAFPDSVRELDEFLRSFRWKVFKRLRQHLCARYPNEQTKPWVREFVLEKDDYGLWPHNYEFQQMLRSSCEHFREKLLTKEERTKIFDDILRGPSKERYVTRWGGGFTEELFERHQKHFHRMQFKPFLPVLFGEYVEYFRQIEDDNNLQISADDYLQIGDMKISTVLNRSPKSPADLAVFSDQKLLDYINQWDEGHGLEIGGESDEQLVEINIEALAEAFGTVFRDSILPNADRLRFWVEHRENLERTIYVRTMIKGMEEYVREKKFDKLEESFLICGWVLSHPDQNPSPGFGSGEESRNDPNWHSSRRAVGDFIGTCLEEEVNVPVSAKEQLAKLLAMLSTQFDWRLDSNEPVFLDQKDHVGEAINNTRSRALQSLIKFGLWLKRNGNEADTSFVMEILQLRLASETEFPLALPERAIIGLNFGRVLDIDWVWGSEHHADVFPGDSVPEWRAAFGAFLRVTRPNKPMFETLRDQFEFALENLRHLKVDTSPGASLIDRLGQHLFTYYLWGMYQLKGEESLLDRFFRKTSGQPGYWAALFRHIGSILRNVEQLDHEGKDKFMTFFEWRLGQGEAKELEEFWLWLESSCLDAEWRLDAFSRTLDIGQPKRTQLYGAVATLDEMLPGYPAKVVECFAKLTEKLGEDTSYIFTEPAKKILKAGLVNTVEEVRSNAERARDNLLRMGRSDLLDLND